MKKSLLIFLLIFGNISFGQNPLSLNEAVKIALKENPAARIAKNNLNIASNNTNIGNADFLPQIDFTLSTKYNDNYANIYGIKRFSSFTYNMIAIKATYILFNGFRNFFTYNKNNLLRKYAEFTLKSTLENLLIQVIQGYNEIAKLQENLLVAKESMEISRERMFRQKSRNEYGQKSNVDYLSSIVDFNKDSLNYIYVLTNLKQAKQRFNKLLNRDWNTEFSVLTDVNYNKIPSLEKLTELALMKNSEINSARLKLKISEEEKNIANSLYYPNLFIESFYGYNNMPPEFSLDFNNPDKSFYAAVTLSFNIFNGFKNKIQSQNARILLENSKLNLEETERNLRTEISNSYLSYLNAKTAYELEKTNLDVAKVNFEKTKELYDLGKITLTQFREAQLKLVSVKLGISGLKYSIKDAETNLLKLAGILLSEY